MHTSGATTEQLVRENIGFVVTIARDYLNRGLDFEDLLGEGSMGLIKAAHRYDPARGTKFTTYAVWWIRKSILQALSDQTRTIRIPVNQFKNGGRTTDAPLPKVVADSTDEDGVPRTLERYPDHKPCAERVLLTGEAQRQVRKAVERLSDAERHVLNRRFGLDDEPTLTLREIGSQLGVSHERVRQIESLAKKRIRGWLNRQRIASVV